MFWPKKWGLFLQGRGPRPPGPRPWTLTYSNLSPNLTTFNQLFGFECVAHTALKKFPDKNYGKNATLNWQWALPVTVKASPSWMVYVMFNHDICQTDSTNTTVRKRNNLATSVTLLDELPSMTTIVFSNKRQWCSLRHRNIVKYVTFSSSNYASLLWYCIFQYSMNYSLPHQRSRV